MILILGSFRCVLTSIHFKIPICNLIGLFNVANMYAELYGNIYLYFADIRW